MTTLAVLAKVPAPGQVKTRFAADSSPQWASDFASACLFDIIERTWNCEHRMLWLDRLDPAWLRAADDTGWVCEAQPDGDLGTRIAACIEARPDRVIVLGTDSPTLPGTYVQVLMDHHRPGTVGLGLAADGGFHSLIAHRDDGTQWLSQVEWSSTRTMGSIMQRIHDCGLVPFVAPLWYDVDTVADLHLMDVQFAPFQTLGSPYRGRHAEEFLMRWKLAHPHWSALHGVES
jgi:glycosyltransferase A (GT-A) superfamily protein (DUF2064 family)